MENVMQNEVMPVVALRGLVVFPGDTLHFEVGRKKSIRAIEEAMSDKRLIFLVAQKQVGVEEPNKEDLYKIGVIASIKQTVKMPGSENVRVTVEGICRGEISQMMYFRPFLSAVVRKKRETRLKKEEREYVQALMRKVKDAFENYINIAPRVAPDLILKVIDEKNPGHLADYIAGNIMLEYEQRYEILSCLNVEERLMKVCQLLESESRLLSLEQTINERVQERINRNQKEFFLREQLKVISQELGEEGESEEEILEYKDRIIELGLEEQYEEKLLKECSKMAKMSPSSPEAHVSRTYLDTVLSLPWNSSTNDNLNLEHARKILDEDHYGMEKIKTRIIEMLAVRKLNPDISGQIICLAGPPGVGKTSIASSVARAMGRKYTRISLGGIHDEAEIRGHRKTYIGAMMGRIMSAVSMAKSNNPLMLLDEIDKLGSDYKGDPASALLEALDSEQNKAFYDHYIEIPFDLSKVLFITTANDISTIPEPLRDRMEIIELPSYTQDEKFYIAKQHLVKKQRKRHGLNGNMLRISDDALREIIDSFTREAGVRTLERQIGTLCRKAAINYDENCKCLTIRPENLEILLGSKKYKNSKDDKIDEIGVVNGLAWTAVGGEMLKVEALVMDGSGKLELTGSLGDVMKESAKAAVSFIRKNCEKYSIESDFYKKKDIHIHFPQGAVPKDGPSAGVTCATALLSALSGRKVKHSVAMTGEVTLTGKVLPIGGLREKTMAAYLNNIKKVIIPYDNMSDIDEVVDIVKNNVEFIFAKTLDDVFDNSIVFTKEEAASNNSFEGVAISQPNEQISTSISQ